MFHVPNIGSRRFAARLFGAMVAILLAACATHPVIDAYRRDASVSDAARTIADYCQSCHVHRDFDPASHLARVPSRYTREPYLSATDCRTCHQVGTNFWNDLTRSTTLPDGSLTDE